MTVELALLNISFIGLLVAVAGHIQLGMLLSNISAVGAFTWLLVSFAIALKKKFRK